MGCFSLSVVAGASGFSLLEKCLPAEARQASVQLVLPRLELWSVRAEGAEGSHKVRFFCRVINQHHCPMCDAWVTVERRWSMGWLLTMAHCRIGCRRWFLREDSLRGMVAHRFRAWLRIRRIVGRVVWGWLARCWVVE